MDEERDKRLLRYLTGELDPRADRELESELARDPGLVARRDELARRWRELDLPPTSPVPPGFPGRVVVLARESRRQAADPRWSLAPGWARAAAGVGLALGLSLGVVLGGWGETREAGSGAPDLAPLTAETDPLAESYWALFEEEGDEEAGR